MTTDSTLNDLNAQKPILSCVVDTHPKFLMQSWIWLVSAHLAGAFKDCNVCIHHVGEPPQVLKDAAARFGARLVIIEPFGEGAARYCNKLQSHAPILETSAKGAILTDVDLFFFSSPADCFDSDFLRAKIVDHPNPPQDLLAQLGEALELSGLEFNGTPTFCAKTHTHMLNCNGGIYICPIEKLRKIAPIWRNFSTRCLTREDILSKFLFHSDQIGFMMSMIATEQPFKPIRPEWNFPTHLKPEAYEPIDIEDIKIIHYHNRLSEDGRLIPVGVSKIDKFIYQANNSLAEFEDLPEFKVIQKQYIESLT